MSAASVGADPRGGDARLAIPAVVAWVVLGLLIAAPDWLGSSAIVLWAIAAAAGGAAVASPRLRRTFAAVTVIGAFAALLVSSAALLTAQRRPLALVDAAAAGRYITATVTTNAPVHPHTQRGPLPITLTSVSIGTTELTAIGIPALLFGSAPNCDTGSRPGCGIGTVLTVAGTVVLADAGEKATFLVFARGSPRVVSAPAWYLDWANSLRSGFSAAASELPGDGGALLPGLAIGDTSVVDSTLDAAMKSTSLSHLTAVSGANCAVVVGLILIGGAAVGLSRRWRVGLAILVLAGFVVLVTPSASVLRAAVMTALVLCMMACGRPIRGVSVLVLAVIVLLVIDPWLSRDYGFILSVLATAGLLLLSGPLARILARWLPAWLAVLISIPLAAQLACQPVLILLNPAVPVYGVIANLLSGPAAPAATVLGLLACVTLPAIEPLGRMLAAVAWLPSAWIAAVARFFDGLPGAQAPWLAGALGVGLMAGVIMVGLFVVLPPAHGPSRARRLAASVLILALVGYGGAIAGNWVGRVVSMPQDWQIAACDIGQGDAVLVRSEGQVALIDTGPDPGLLAECLDELGIDRIQLLVLTHYDLDHVGGTTAVLGMVDRAIVGPASDASDTRLRESLSATGAQLEEVSRGLTGFLGELRWEVLWPPSRLGTIELGNPASVTLRFDGVGSCADGCLSGIFLGDLGEESQSRMLGVAKPQPVDVVKVAHHGSADQSERLYERLQPRVGIIGVGADNSYGHPTDALLDMLKRVGTVIARTDLDGMILLSPAADGGVRMWTERAPQRDVGAH